MCVLPLAPIVDRLYHAFLDYTDLRFADCAGHIFSLDLPDFTPATFDAVLVDGPHSVEILTFGQRFSRPVELFLEFLTV